MIQKKSIKTGYELYYAIQECARVVAKHGVNADRYRDISFILQMMRLAFFFTLFTSFVSGVLINIFGNMIGICSQFTIFIILSIVLSLFLIYLIPVLSRALGKRYIREVENAYEAVRYDSFILGRQC
jgi:hypothetical protein